MLGISCWWWLACAALYLSSWHLNMSTKTVYHCQLLWLCEQRGLYCWCVRNPFTLIHAAVAYVILAWHLHVNSVQSPVHYPNAACAMCQCSMHMFLQLLRSGSTCKTLTLLLAIASLIKFTAQISDLACCCHVACSMLACIAVHKWDLGC